MSKTFKSVTDNESELDVRANDCGVFIAFSRAGQIRQASTFAPSDAPALALAILEAAIPKGQISVSAAMGDALHSLRDEVKRIDERNAAVRERAELEAEALELLNASRESNRRPTVETFDGFESTKQSWLAVARKAREMAKEAPNA